MKKRHIEVGAPPKKLIDLIHLLSYNYADLKLYDVAVFLAVTDNLSNNKTTITV